MAGAARNGQYPKDDSRRAILQGDQDSCCLQPVSQPRHVNLQLRTSMAFQQRPHCDLVSYDAMCAYQNPRWSPLPTLGSRLSYMEGFRFRYARFVRGGSGEGLFRCVNGGAPAR
jgi:hypothetical protein